MEVVSREEAKAKGLDRFYTGVPCRNGHFSERSTSHGRCLECKRASSKSWTVKNNQRSREIKKKWRDEHPEQSRACSASYRERNLDRHKEVSRARYIANPQRVTDQLRAWRKANPGKTKAQKALRRAREMEQTCACCTKEDFDLVYALAESGVHQVDHIVPLALGGEHCTWNLQVLPIAKHREKTKKDVAAIAAARKVGKSNAVAA